MKVLCSSKGIVDIKHPGQGILDIAETGFSSIMADLSAVCKPKELEALHRENICRNSVQILSNTYNLQGILDSLAKTSKRAKMPIDIMLSPYLAYDSKREDLNSLLLELAKDSMEACGKNKCKYLVVCPLFVGLEGSSIWEKNKEFYLKLAYEAKEHHVMILLENLNKNVNGHLTRGICSDGYIAAEWVDMLNSAASELYGQREYFGFCMNVGSCNLCGQNMYDFVMALGSRIKAVIMADNNGRDMATMLPFTSAQRGTSQTDWLQLIRGLREIKFDGELVIEFGDTANSFSPILRPQLLQLAKATGDYFKWQIELEILLNKYSSRVLFGAGNMCRNYMKCYGVQYPPLYTCDNNSAKWGTQFCGLTIQSPESLKELPEDTAIFICNIYYREIKQQLCEMGIRNPIEFFSDEYLPSFYFDRVEDIMERKECGGTQIC